jgi:hypothetical protein
MPKNNNKKENKQKTPLTRKAPQRSEKRNANETERNLFLHLAISFFFLVPPPPPTSLPARQPKSMNLRLFRTVLNTTQDATETIALEHPEHVPCKDFDGRMKWKRYLGTILDQGECGACYAFATTSVLQDRYNMFTNNALHIVLNPLQALVCHPTDLTSLEYQLLQFDTAFMRESELKTQFTACSGGSLTQIARYFYRLGAVETKCVSIAPIEKHINDTNQLPVCSQLGPSETCLDPSVIKRYWPVLDFYIVCRSKDLGHIATCMQYDICQNGPMIAGFKVYEDFLTDYDGKSVYIPKNDRPFLFGHAVKIVGWGSQMQHGEMIDYWLCANSWGAQWGDNGYFKMQRANSLLETEWNHLSLIPQIPGILRYFKFASQSSHVDDLDMQLRRVADVNPFTLLSAEGLRLAQAQKLQIELVFQQFNYPIIFERCCASSRKLKNTLAILLTTITAVLVVVTIALILWNRKQFM